MVINFRLGTASTGWLVDIKHIGNRKIRMKTGTLFLGPWIQKTRCRLRLSQYTRGSCPIQVLSNSTLAVQKEIESSVLRTECAGDAPGLCCVPQA